VSTGVSIRVWWIHKPLHSQGLQFCCIGFVNQGLWVRIPPLAVKTAFSRSCERVSCARECISVRGWALESAKQDAKSTTFPSVPVAFSACPEGKDRSGSLVTASASRPLRGLPSAAGGLLRSRMGRARVAGSGGAKVDSRSNIDCRNRRAFGLEILPRHAILIPVRLRDAVGHCGMEMSDWRAQGVCLPCRGPLGNDNAGAGGLC
jgi:hypothetical protein